MIRIDIDSLILHRAEQIVKSENIPGGAQDRSISGKGDRATWCGAVGQAVFERAMEERQIGFTITSVKEHDYLVPAGTLEIKSKERSVEPQPHYEASAYEYNQAWQQPDWIGFVSLRFAPGYNKDSGAELEKYDVGWVAGVIRYGQFKSIARKIEKGAELPHGQLAGFVSLNCEYSDLEGIEKLKEEA